MIRRTTWITLGVFVALTAFAVWFTRLRPGAGEPADATPTIAPIWELASDSIRTIAVEDLADGKGVELERQDDGTWVVLSPEGQVVDASRAERAATWLAAPRPRSSLPLPQDLGPFGLDEVLWRVTVTLADDSVHVFEVGAETPTGTTTYVRVPDGTDILILSKYGLEEVLGLVDEILATPTPEASPTASPTPAATPVSGATPTP